MKLMGDEKGNHEDILLDVQNLKKHFPIHGGIFGRKKGVLRAVEEVSFQLRKGETLGIVGESGSGKSTMGRMVMRVLEPTEGKVIFGGREITAWNRSKLRPIRGEFQMVFQDPFTALNPKMKVKDILAEPFLNSTKLNRTKIMENVFRLLSQVGLRESDSERYPHQFSGGQRQRIGIATAIALNPKLIVADEPVSALDVSVQSQILNLMVDLKKQFGLSYIFISHDLAVVKHISDRVGVMYLGHLVEMAGAESLYENPLHPYTQALLSAVLHVGNNRNNRERIVLKGEIPKPTQQFAGCPFHTRCPKKMDICESVRPAWKSVKEDHWTACHLY